MLTCPRLFLSIEEAALLVAAVTLYAYLHFSWLLFAALFLAPDLFMLGYLANPRVGSALYNLGHWLILPLALLGFAVFQHHPIVMAISIIWIAHITFDRTLGYGFKYPTFFKDTHLQRV